MTDERITDDALAQWEALANAATAGPWVYMDDHTLFAGELRCGAEDQPFTHIADTPKYDDRPQDFEFIAASRDAVPALIAEVRRLRAQLHRHTRTGTIGGEMGSHWPECWRTHIDCATVEVERLRDSLDLIVARIGYPSELPDEALSPGMIIVRKLATAALAQAGGEGK